jgi:23S rRNA-/tRNA-specific pseudouridylate synthase
LVNTYQAVTFIERLKFLLSRNVTKISKRKEKVDPLVYVTTPQRLDQNTSGLFVLATKKTFAAYFAKLLRKKTDKELNTENYPSSSNNDIQKKYRCLVCVGSNANRSGGDCK